jgi:hypothetical protein
MKLVSNNCEYWARIDDSSNDSVHIAICNPSRRPKPFMTVSIYDGDLVEINGIQHYSTCSSDKQMGTVIQHPNDTGSLEGNHGKVRKTLQSHLQ